MDEIRLPKTTSRTAAPKLGNTRQITIIGGNGAGKTRFMEEMAQLAPGRAYHLSALQASFPERQESTVPGSIDALYRDAVQQASYMRTDAVSELDKLTYMIFSDELESLLSMKEHMKPGERRMPVEKTKFDIIRELWEKIFPGNRIVRHRGSLMFATTSGDDLITSASLSQGEKTVLYYAAAVLYAMPDALIFIDSPTLFIHPSIIGPLWNAIERLRPDCTFIYNSVDVDFVNSRTRNKCIWVKSYDSEKGAWDYQVLDSTPLSEEIFVEIAGSRKPVLFIEGDMQHSIDAKLYGLVFRDWTVRPLGSCDKVIEATRSFNDLKSMHHLLSRGIVDRDRRTDVEVEYLRKKNILVPDVAEIENIFMLEPLIRVMARRRGKSPDKVIGRVRREVIRMFKQQAEEQALQHTRHRMKREVECKIDGRFSCITALETHIRTLINKLQPRKYYNTIREQFAVMVRDNDYPGILRVFNHKPMLSNSNVHCLLGFHSKEDYIAGVLDVLKENSKDSATLRETIKYCFHVDESTGMQQ